MPQIAPLNWLSLYMYFITLFILTIIINYYIFLYQPKIKFESKKKLQYNWKW